MVINLDLSAYIMKNDFSNNPFAEQLREAMQSSNPIGMFSKVWQTRKLKRWTLRTSLLLILYIAFWNSVPWFRWTLLITLPIQLFSLAFVLLVPRFFKKRMEKVQQQFGQSFEGAMSNVQDAEFEEIASEVEEADFEEIIDTPQTLAPKTPPVLVGLALGDALGVPFEFKSRATIQYLAPKEMQGHGTHDQPAGTWSDDSSMAFCLAESLLAGYDLQDISEHFIAWMDEAYWTAHDEVFDIGNRTQIALRELKQILQQTNPIPALQARTQIQEEYENGNGALMRCIPLLFLLKGQPSTQQYKIIHEVSALTHRHSRSAMACFIYLKFAEFLLQGLDKETAYSKCQESTQKLWQDIQFPQKEQTHFQRLILKDIRQYTHAQCNGSGYVIHTLEASFWCILQKDNFLDAVWAAIYLGEDTDTTAAVTGSLAALAFGLDDVPHTWLGQLARINDIQTLQQKLVQHYS